MISAVQNWLSEMRAFWQRLFKRDRPSEGPITLDRRRVYIIPSRSGAIFALILLAMLIGAINYQNSLAFILTFLLTSLAVVSMIHTVRNLYGLRLSAGHAQPVFVGEHAHFPVNIENPGDVRRFALKLMFQAQEPHTLDLPHNGGQWITLTLPTHLRGYLYPGRITLYSRFPFGLFHAWSYVNLSMQCLVYPHPDNSGNLPPHLVLQRGSIGDQGRGSDDFSSLRPYHPGDSLRHVHWKTLAREQGLMTKQFGGGVTQELWLHWEQVSNLSLEQRLSRLTRWVLDADSLGISYGLVLPDQKLPLGAGERHRARCLESLATFGLTNKHQCNE